MTSSNVAEALRPVLVDLDLKGTVERSRADSDAIYLAQQRARDVLTLNRRLVPIPGKETPLEYRKRIAEALKPNTSLAQRAIARENAATFADSEAQILKEARANYLRPLDVEAGKLVEVKYTDHAGREVREYATGQKGVDPKFRPASAKRSVYGAFMGVAVQSAVHVDGVPHPSGYYRP